MRPPDLGRSGGRWTRYSGLRSLRVDRRAGPRAAAVRGSCGRPVDQVPDARSRRGDPPDL